jgi:hypothetical protein
MANRDIKESRDERERGRRDCSKGDWMPATVQP